MRFTDKASLAGTRKTSDGYLVAEVRTARTGIQEYAGFEVGVSDKEIVRVYRPEDQVFHKDSMGSYAHRPVTNDHPPVSVTADTWKDFSVGQIGDEVARDGDYVRIPLIVMDASAIKDIEDGKRELSAGYTCDLAFEPGVTPDGEQYDAVQKNIKINHVAIVQHGRAGSKARIGDSAKTWGVRPFTCTDEKENPMPKELTTMVVGDKAIEVVDKDAPVLEAFKKTVADERATLVATHDAAIADLNKQLAARDAKIAELEAQVMDESALDAAVTERADLIAKATAIVPGFKADGLSNADIRKEVVVKKLGDSMKDKPESYVEARFDILAEDLKNTNDLRAVISHTHQNNTNDADQLNASRNSYLDRLTRRTPAK